jgi:hypothetical protein
VRRVFHTDGTTIKGPILSECEVDLGARVRRATSDFDFGLEVALTWLGQLEARSTSLAEPSMLVHSIKSVLGDIHLVLLEVSSGETTLLHHDFKMPKSKIKRLCRPKEFYGKLARIRFTKFYHRDFGALETLASNGESAVESLVAVPVFLRGVPKGCLAAASSAKDHILGSTEAMVLSLAAAVYSLAREIRKSRGQGEF